MNVYKFSEKLPDFRDAVLTIGTFDGVHVGHQTIINRLKNLAAEIGGETVVLTFHPHPRLVLNPDDDTLKLINTLDEKAALLNAYGVDNLIIARFTEAFSQMEPEQYVHDFLVEKIKPKIIVIGYDHHFGKDRKGNITILKTLKEKYNYQVEEISKQLVDDIAVSSTKVRNALLAGEIKKANDLLGHMFSFEGKVVKGFQIGSKLGFPTANIEVEDKNKLIPSEGVYAAMVYLKGERYKGMLYIGNRPTFSGTDRAIEINIFNFENNIYGEKIKIELVAEVRGDEKFDSPEALKLQLNKDKAAAEKILSDI